VPTKRKRHSVTETDEVGVALRRVEAATGTRPDLAELVVLGSEVKISKATEHRERDQAQAQLRARFLERTRTGEGIDLDALDRVRAAGWRHE
jgi:hypothetical protein